MTLIQRYYNLVSSQFLRFILVGGLNTAFGVGVYCLAIYVGIPYYIATLLSNVLGVCFNFITTGNLVFRNNNPRLIFRFVMAYVLIYFINTAVVKVFILLGMNDYWAGILATPVVALCSYSLLKHFVYRKNQTQS
ncbi:MAG: GtrA family protein [Prevotella sp.]|nr:GtrA family protein [Prevotella sp.]